eukprot:4747509-Pleurochrysis_carterae.AAC.1
MHETRRGRVALCLTSSPPRCDAFATAAGDCPRQGGRVLVCRRASERASSCTPPLPAQRVVVVRCRLVRLGPVYGRRSCSG